MIKRKSMPEFEKGRQVAIVKMAEEYENFPEDWVETFPTIMVEAVNTTIQLLQARSDFQEAFESAVIASNLEEAVEDHKAGYKTVNQGWLLYQLDKLLEQSETVAQCEEGYTKAFRDLPEDWINLEGSKYVRQSFEWRRCDLGYRSNRRAVDSDVRGSDFGITIDAFGSFVGALISDVSGENVGHT